MPNDEENKKDELENGAENSGVDNVDTDIDNDEDEDDGAVNTPAKSVDLMGEEEGKVQSSVVDEISQNLSEKSEEIKTVDETKPEANEPVPFDFSKFSADDLARLKQMLQSAPDRVARKKGNSIIKLPSFNDKLIIDFKSAYLALVDDAVNLRKKEIHMIPVKFLGEKDFVAITYEDFRHCPRVLCEVLGVESKKDEVVEGETISMETGGLVEMVRVDVITSLRVKTPKNGEVVIPSKVANA